MKGTKMGNDLFVNASAYFEAEIGLNWQVLQLMAV